jgi:two-component system, NarL family, nitrate/nitrite response regulator NarL
MTIAKTIRVAIIDGHPCTTWGLERLIATEAPRMAAVGCAHDLPAARTLLQQAHPDVVVMDLDVEGESSVGLIPEFADSGTRFLILTGQRDSQVHDQALLAGARGLLAKSEQPETILRAIECVHAGELWLNRVRTGCLVDSLRRHAAQPAADPFAALTRRERQIAATAFEHNGAPNRRLAELLGISENTLRNALSTIYAKTGVANRLQLFALAARHPPRR